MKRLIVAAMLAVALGALVGASVQVLTTGGTPGGAKVVEAMPYPRTTSPLPVPEVVIGQEPWRDPLPSAAPKKPSGFVARCSPTSRSTLGPDLCRARPLTDVH